MIQDAVVPRSLAHPTHMLYSVGGVVVGVDGKTRGFKAAVEHFEYLC